MKEKQEKEKRRNPFYLRSKFLHSVHDEEQKDLLVAIPSI